MKKTIVTLACVLCTVINVFAQQKINVQNKSKVEFYDSLQVAVNKAISGDTLYLPGGNIPMPAEVVIDKKLTIIGVGWDIDSVGAGLLPTVLNGYINFREGSDGSLITGCKINNIQLGHYDFSEVKQDIKDITITRNYVNYVILGIRDANDYIKKIYIKENSINSLYGYSVSECLIENNIILSFDGLAKSQIANNVIKSNNNNNNNNGYSECIFENNYFNSVPYTQNCIFNNNAINADIVFPYGTNTGSNNLVNQDAAKTFVSISLDAPKNVVVKSSSPSKTGGVNGTEIGIYGGTNPYKSGAIPFNPHFGKFVVATKTDKDGKLFIEIISSAQTR